MPGDHLQDPLDYLYEELPPEKMAEARKHLAECQECRAEMRAVRETVKLYREAGKPATPPGLAARAAARALEAARAEQTPADDADRSESAAQPEVAVQPDGAARSEAMVQPEVVARPDSPRSLDPVSENLERMLREQQSKISRESLDAEYNRIREEVLGEVGKKTWRGWLFHPAWTVAASVIFICALLIQFSPRMNRPEVLYLPAARDGEAAKRIRERERLPAATVILDDSAVVPAAGAPAILGEAEALNASPIAPPPTSIPAPVPAPSSAPAQARSTTPQPFSARAAQSGDPVSAAVSVKDDIQPPTATATEKNLPRRSDHTTGFLVAAPAEPAAVAEPAPAENAEHAENVEDTEDETPVVSEAIESVDSIESTDSTESVESTESTEEVGPVIMDMFPMEPPQLIARPTPINVPERIQTLTTLAALQMANGEYEDAWKSVRLLEGYDKDAARNLAEVLAEIEKAALAEAEKNPTTEDARGQDEEPPAAPAVPEPEEEEKSETAPEPETEPEPEVKMAPATEEKEESTSSVEAVEAVAEPEAEKEEPESPAEAVEAAAELETEQEEEPEPSAEAAQTQSDDQSGTAVETAVEKEGEAEEVFAPIDPYKEEPEAAPQPVVAPPAPVVILEEPPVDPPMSVVRVPAPIQQPMYNAGPPEQWPAPTPSAPQRLEAPIVIPDPIPAPKVVLSAPASEPEAKAATPQEAESAAPEPAPAPTPVTTTVAQPEYAPRIHSSRNRTPSPRRRAFSTDPYIRGY